MSSSDEVVHPLALQATDVMPSLEFRHPDHPDHPGGPDGDSSGTGDDTLDPNRSEPAAFAARRDREPRVPGVPVPEDSAHAIRKNLLRQKLFSRRRAAPVTFGRFKVLDVIGQGGMGIVYACYDDQLERKVAVKVLLGKTFQNVDIARARLLREAQAMARLSHPNVVQVFEAGEFDDVVYLAMEYIEGRDLRTWLGVRARSWREIVAVFLQAGHGLAAAHEAGVIHRDFKPDNVLVGDDGRVRVLDFGLARPAAGDETEEYIADGAAHSSHKITLTKVGAYIGTPAYMSPEQHLCQPADARSDQFSFCVALYGALYGHAPFEGLTLMELSENVIEGRLRPPPAGTPVPAWVFEALRTGLATAPDDRHPSMDTLLAALTPDQVTMSRRRWQWPATLVGVSMLAVLLTLLVVGGTAPTGADLEAIERLTLAARDAAGRMQWVYPTPEDPRDTAYNRVVLLENLGGAATGPAFAAATGLRSEFAEGLVVLGDRYFDDPQSRPYARDYYVQALVFMPTDARASERSGVTLGQIGDLQVRAAQGEFGDAELDAAEPLRILADPDRIRAHDSALAFAHDVARGSALGREHATTVFRKSGLLTPAELEPTAAPPVVAIAEPPPVTPDPSIIVDAPVTEEPLPTRLERDRRLKLKPVDDTKTAPPPEPEPEPPAASDPDASRALSDQASTARRRGETESAEALYNQALDLWNSNAAALIGLSDIHFERGDFDRAVKYAEKGVRADASAENLIRLGDSYFKVFRYSDAQQRYQRAAALGHPRAEERLARVREKLGG